VAPVCLALIVSCAAYDWPLRLRFAASRSAFEQAARDCLAGKPFKTPAWIGLYRVRRVFSEGSGTVGFQTGHSVVDPTGFEFRSNAPAAGDDDPACLVPQWYVAEW